MIWRRCSHISTGQSIARQCGRYAQCGARPMASSWAGRSTGGWMSNTLDHRFQSILDDARADPYVLGMCLGGSRGKGFENESSDYDICIIMADDTPERMRERYQRLNSALIDLWTMTLSEFRATAAWGGSTHWNRYSYAHVNA